MDFEFLDVEDVLELHQLHIEASGGSSGLRSWDLLDSAIAQPRATYSGAYLHGDLFAMAAAYLFHIVKNHPFIDGNKRAGLAAALTFLEINGHAIDQPSEALYGMTEGAAAGAIDKDAIADMLRYLAGADE